MLDYFDDIVSDFSVFHGIRDVTRLSGQAFFRMAFRLTAYQGVMQARIRAVVHEQETGPTPASRPAPGPMYGGGQERRVTPATKAALQASGAFRGIFSFAGG